MLKIGKLEVGETPSEVIHSSINSEIGTEGKEEEERKLNGSAEKC